MATRFGQEPVVRFLLENGADPSTVNGGAVHYALSQGNIQLAELVRSWYLS